MNALESNYGMVHRILVYVLVLNIVVVVGKMFVGFLSNSLSMISDSLHSLLDASSNIIGLIGINIARRKPDEGHPYGHTKYVSLATLSIAFLLVITGFEVFQGAISRFINPVTPEITLLNWIVMLVTISINIFVSRFEKNKGIKLKSSILVADSLHTNTDIYVSLSVIVSFILIILGYPLFDPVISILIALVIFYTGFSIISKMSGALTDSLVIPSDLIKKVVYNVQGVRGVHKIRSRGTDTECFIDLHVIVDSKLSVEEGHSISVEVEENLKQAFPFIKDVTVHIEPFFERGVKRG